LNAIHYICMTYKRLQAFTCVYIPHFNYVILSSTDNSIFGQSFKAINIWARSLSSLSVLMQSKVSKFQNLIVLEQLAKRLLEIFLIQYTQLECLSDTCKQMPDSIFQIRIVLSSEQLAIFSFDKISISHTDSEWP